MNILHLNSNLDRSRIHSNIVASLNKLDEVDGKIFFPTEKKSKFQYKENFIDEVKCLSKYERYFYFYRNRHLLKITSELYNGDEYTHILAHSLFSNGKLAMDLSKNLKIPYSIIVTNTDVNKYFKNMIHLRKIGENILKNASSIIFTSSTYKERVINQYISKESRKNISEKSSCIPFGIEDFWIENRQKSQIKKVSETTELLYVGKINKNKNLIFLADTIEKMNLEKTKRKFKLTIIGECENSEDIHIKEVLMSKKNVEVIDFLDKKELLNYYKKADLFIMISKTESFGLVYAEAMTQGLPVIYTRNEGFDKQFEDYLIGVPVTPSSYLEIKDAINYILLNHKTLSENAFNQSQVFSWKNIAIRFKNCLINSNTEEINEIVL